MTDIYELLICIGSGLILLILLSGLIGNNIICIEVPLLGRIPLGLLVAVALALYGSFGLIFLGFGQAISKEFALTTSIRTMLGIFATLTSYCLGKMIMHMFQETPLIPFSDRAVGLTATIRYQPESVQIGRSGDAIVFDCQEKITQIITVYLADWAVEKDLKKNESVRIIDYLPHKKAFLVIKTGGVDEFSWQNLLFHR